MVAQKVLIQADMCKRLCWQAPRTLMQQFFMKQQRKRYYSTV